MSEDTDIGIAVDSGPEIAEAQIAREQESDAKLDKSVREAALKAFSGEARPDVSTDKSIDDTLKATMDKIMARPEPPSPPPLRPGHSLDEAAAAAHDWTNASAADRRTLSDAHKEVALMKQAATGFELKCESFADLAEMRRLLDKQNNGAAFDPDVATALSPDAPDQAPAVLREVVNTWQEGPQGVRQILEQTGYSPFDLMTPHEQAALAGTNGGEIGSVVAQNMDIFARAGVSPAQGVAYLLQAQRMLETNPEQAIAHLAQAYGVSAPMGGAAQEMNSILGEWAQTKGDALTPAIRQEMASIIQEPKFDGNQPTLNLLNAAFSEAKRRAGIRAKRGVDVKMTETLTVKAKEIYQR